MFDKGGEGFFAGGKKALPSPCSFFSHTRREEQGRAAGNRPDRDKKAPPWGSFQAADLESKP